MVYLAEKFANWIIQNGGAEDDREVYVYGVECFLNTVLTFGIIIVVGILLNRIDITLIWLIFFVPLRHSSGGMHASNHINCLITSLSIGIGCMLLNPFLLSTIWIVVIGLIGSIIIIFSYAPVIHANHPIPNEKTFKIRKIARYVIVIESIAILILAFVSFSYATAAILGVLSASTSTLIGHIKNRTF